MREETFFRKFYDRIMPVTESGCHIWMGYVDSWGYGRCRYKSEKTLTHRIAWILEHGQIPEGMSVLHKCDVPSCVNIDHLYLGTHQDNMNDRTRRNRTNRAFGPENPNWKGGISAKRIS